MKPTVNLSKRKARVLAMSVVAENLENGTASLTWEDYPHLDEASWELLHAQISETVERERAILRELATRSAYAIDIDDIALLEQAKP